MSVEKTIYLGCYIVAKKKTNEITKTTKVCPEGHHKGKCQTYCPICGSKTIEYVTTKTEVVTLNSLMNDLIIPYNFYDRLLNIGNWDEESTETFVPNSIFDHLDITELDENYSLMNVDMVQEVEKFNEEYSVEIKLIKDNYETCDIQYGICYDYR